MLGHGDSRADGGLCPGDHIGDDRDHAGGARRVVVAVDCSDVAGSIRHTHAGHDHR